MACGLFQNERDSQNKLKWWNLQIEGKAYLFSGPVFTLCHGEESISKFNYYTTIGWKYCSNTNIRSAGSQYKLITMFVVAKD